MLVGVEEVVPPLKVLNNVLSDNFLKQLYKMRCEGYRAIVLWLSCAIFLVNWTNQTLLDAAWAGSIDLIQALPPYSVDRQRKFIFAFAKENCWKSIWARR